MDLINLSVADCLDDLLTCDESTNNINIEINSCTAESSASDTLLNQCKKDVSDLEFQLATCHDVVSENDTCKQQLETVVKTLDLYISEILFCISNSLIQSAPLEGISNKTQQTLMGVGGLVVCRSELEKASLIFDTCTRKVEYLNLATDSLNSIKLCNQSIAAYSYSLIDIQTTLLTQNKIDTQLYQCTTEYNTCSNLLSKINELKATNEKYEIEINNTEEIANRLNVQLNNCSRLVYDYDSCASLLTECKHNKSLIEELENCRLNYSLCVSNKTQLEGALLDLLNITEKYTGCNGSLNACNDQMVFSSNDLDNWLLKNNTLNTTAFNKIETTRNYINNLLNQSNVFATEIALFEKELSDFSVLRAISEKLPQDAFTKSFLKLSGGNTQTATWRDSLGEYCINGSGGIYIYSLLSSKFQNGSEYFSTTISGTRFFIRKPCQAPDPRLNINDFSEIRFQALNYLNLYIPIDKFIESYGPCIENFVVPNRGAVFSSSGGCSDQLLTCQIGQELLEETNRACSQNLEETNQLNRECIIKKANLTSQLQNKNCDETEISCEALLELLEKNLLEFSQGIAACENKVSIEKIVNKTITDLELRTKSLFNNVSSETNVCIEQLNQMNTSINAICMQGIPLKDLLLVEKQLGECQQNNTILTENQVFGETVERMLSLSRNNLNLCKNTLATANSLCTNDNYQKELFLYDELYSKLQMALQNKGSLVKELDKCLLKNVSDDNLESCLNEYLSICDGLILEVSETNLKECMSSKETCWLGVSKLKETLLETKNYTKEFEKCKLKREECVYNLLEYNSKTTKLIQLKNSIIAYENGQRELDKRVASLEVAVESQRKKLSDLSLFKQTLILGKCFDIRSKVKALASLWSIV